MRPGQYINGDRHTDAQSPFLPPRSPHGVHADDRPVQGRHTLFVQVQAQRLPPREGTITTLYPVGTSTVTLWAIAVLTTAKPARAANKIIRFFIN